MPAKLSEIVEHLDEYLRIGAVVDDARALNGLQVTNRGDISRIVSAVDACLATIEAASNVHGSLLLVHHGLFWSGLQPLVGRHARRLHLLRDADVALYSAHLPLDLHDVVGNNAILARLLGVSDVAPFGKHGDASIGVHGRLDLTRDVLAARLADLLETQPRILALGPERVRRVAIVTGAGSEFLKEAHDIGVDTFITGEGPHHTYVDAEEWGLNLVYAGHYATETLGVKALGLQVAKRFGLPWEFVDHPTGL